ncbi:YjbE family putative metal transport protein [Paraburkholderia sp. MMS20-SJTR3]|uniref:YjbE family putative metal transport protein n=1 Tax=Paraburkholderia sejongensis TaxID=2886946 RepID=A0ABS8K0D2_9BURK|nr:YjbE family putative metal transport protein [Paraburkholderia sp. MMS20-SJTR3]MCC8395594.1 YjbE family putative metal transport protein [Paraburkholderia sp. MMS20-SJTR3]
MSLLGISQDFTAGFAHYVPAVLQIVFINLLLGGDNAIAIALACRSLPPQQRRAGIWIGTSLGIVLRFAMVYAIGYLLAIPYMHVVAGVLLAWIGMQLLRDDGASHAESDQAPAAKALWRVVALILFADFSMSLDNGLATAAVAETLPAGSRVAVVLAGLAVGAPAIALGSAVMLRVIERFALVVWLGSALLGWIAADMLLADPQVAQAVRDVADAIGDGAGNESFVRVLVCVAMAALVLVVPFMQRVNARRWRAG